MVLTSNIGKNIRLLRENAAMTQKELGKALHVSGNTIEKWENGRNYVKADTVVAIADVFNISCDLLLRGGRTENLVLMNCTGLSDSTVERLKRYNSSEPPHKYIPAAINILAENPLVLMTIWYYLTDVYRDIETHEKTFFANDAERLARLELLDVFSELRKEFWKGCNQ